jgi:adenine specific DNA methylase Mod
MDRSDGLQTGVLYCDDNLERLSVLPSESVDLIYLDPPFFSNKIYEVIWGDEAEVRSFEDRWEGGIQLYINWMRGRLMEMHRVLKPTGSLYLHCDPNASHYLKVMMDGVFGMSNFQNEIVWERSSTRSSISRIYRRAHDVIFFYAKSNSRSFNLQYKELSEASKKIYSKVDERGGQNTRAG